jgi:hypothetical protein
MPWFPGPVVLVNCSHHDDVAPQCPYPPNPRHTGDSRDQYLTIRQTTQAAGNPAGMRRNNVVGTSRVPAAVGSSSSNISQGEALGQLRPKKACGIGDLTDLCKDAVVDARGVLVAAEVLSMPSEYLSHEVFTDRLPKVKP